VNNKAAASRQPTADSQMLPRTPSARAVGGWLLTIGALTALVAPPSEAQYPDAWVIPRGTLRIGFEPKYTSASERFDTTGTPESLGTSFSDDSAGVRLIPTLFNPQNAIWSITGDSSIAINAGAFRAGLVADVRRLPFNFSVGLTDRITLTASVPLVTTRSQVSLEVDSTNADLGWNQAASQAGNATAIAQIQSLLGELEAAAVFVEGQIAAIGYDCPSGPICNQARTAVMDARQMQMDITLLSGVDAMNGAGELLPPFSPMGSSATGQAVTGAIATLVARLTALGAPAVTSTLPLPNSPVLREDVDAMLTDPVFGYSATALGLTKYSNRFGDIEIGMRYGVAQNDKLRAVLIGNVRLPTGSRDLPENYTDIGSGDKQTDVEFRLESVWMPGTHLTLALDASYTLQLGDRLERRVMPYYRPYATLATQTTVQRNLGDMFRIGLYPALRLSSGFTAYMSASYFYKLADKFTLTTPLDVPPSLGGPVSAADLAVNTTYQSLFLGAGLYYRMDRGRHIAKLPIEAGLDYRTAFGGTGGRTPKTTTVNFFLRLYWRLWGGPPAEEDPEAEEPIGR